MPQRPRSKLDKTGVGRKDNADTIYQRSGQMVTDRELRAFRAGAETGAEAELRRRTGAQVTDAERRRFSTGYNSPDQYTDDAPGESVPRKEYHAQQDGLPSTPSGGKPAGGTENLRANQQTKQAAQPQTPSGGKRKWPAGVDSYTDGSV